jgi:hypothetical protein
MVVVATAGAGFTVSFNGEDVEAAKLVLPTYCAVRLYVPAVIDAGV